MGLWCLTRCPMRFGGCDKDATLRERHVQAVNIPAELACGSLDIGLVIENRVGNH